jgi:hypothetical protein
MDNGCIIYGMEYDLLRLMNELVLYYYHYQTLDNTHITFFMF